MRETYDQQKHNNPVYSANVTLKANECNWKGIYDMEVISSFKFLIWGLLLKERICS